MGRTEAVAVALGVPWVTPVAVQVTRSVEVSST
jgi:hypothetical protein